MKYHIRRKDREMDRDKAMVLLEKGIYGVMSTTSDGMPYGIPLSYVVKNDCIYFHCAKTGRKIDNITQTPNVCFTVVGEVKPFYGRNFTTAYQSVMAFGPVAQVTDDDEKREMLKMLCQKYLPQHMDKADGDIDKSWSVTSVYKIAIDILTAKEKPYKP